MNNVSMSPNIKMTSSPITSKTKSMTSYYKSLPALDKDFDQLDRELQQLSDSVDVLYQQEDTEIDFLESFIDYDDISVHNGSYNNSRVNSVKPGLPPIIPSEKSLLSTKDKIRDRIRWFSGRKKIKQHSESKLKSEGQKPLGLGVEKNFRINIKNCRT